MGMKIGVLTCMELGCGDGETGVLAQDRHSEREVFSDFFAN
jgi:hypothetical protein